MAETMNSVQTLSPIRLVALSSTGTSLASASPQVTRCQYRTTIDLPRNLVFIAAFPLTQVEVQDLAHVQLLRLWEVLLEMKNDPHRSPFVDWCPATRMLFEKEMVCDDIRMSIVIVERVLRTKWNEPVAKEESVV